MVNRPTRVSLLATPFATLPLLTLALLAAPLSAQQVPDMDFAPRVTAPTYARGTGPIVGIDEGHNNPHTLSGGFSRRSRSCSKPMAYRMRAVPRRTREALDAL